MITGIVTAAERRVARKLLEMDARSADRAQPLWHLRRIEQRRLAHLMGRGIVHEVGDGTYYIDQTKWIAHGRLRRTIALVVLAAAVIVAMGAAWFTSRKQQAVKDADATVRASIHRYDAMTRAMDADGISALFTNDGEIWNAGHLLGRGPDAIRAYLHSFDGQVHVDAQETTVEHVTVTDATVEVTGRYHQIARMLSDNHGLEIEGKAESEWVRQPDGRWLVRRMSTTPK
jgi:uncharacterized protein (TIGR02246 family)